MSVFKPPYELSVWDEKLEDYIKIEKREDTIASQDMDCLGKASNIKFDSNLNGTHTLSFQMPDGYFDSKLGEFIHNEFVDNLYNEKKVKLFYDDEWYEFYVKSISDEKHLNNYMKTYNCTDAFIEELSRNGYGITFDEELYNNVEEIGTFTKEILDGSIWEYKPEFNWGDFTEYSEERLFKLPVSQFPYLRGYKVNYNIDEDIEIRNIYTGETRVAEMGDDICSGKHFWDKKDGKSPFIVKEKMMRIPNDGYIYIPYSQLEFCYKSVELDNGEVVRYEATEKICYYEDENGNKLSYAIAPSSTNPNDLIQFIAIPKDAEVEVDESGLIVDKNYTYVMTIEEWNRILDSPYYYRFMSSYNNKTKTFEKINGELTPIQLATGNKAAYYEGYLDKIGDLEVVNGKKISITDRTELNTTEEIDQFVTVYNNNPADFENILSKDENWIEPEDLNSYRICSKTETRQVVPQLARNLVQNSSHIKSTQGWDIQCIFEGSVMIPSALIEFGEISEEQAIEEDYPYTSVIDTYLDFTPANRRKVEQIENEDLSTWEVVVKDAQIEYKHNTIINFGLVGHEYEISKDKIYCLGIRADDFVGEILIGEGTLLSQGEYNIINPIVIPSSKFHPTAEKNINGYLLIKFKNDIKNPYIAIHSDDKYKLYNLWFFEAYTKGIDQFETGMYKYSGRELFDNVLIEKTDTYSLSVYYTENDIRNRILFEDDVMPGDTFSYEHYFIQQGGTSNFRMDTFATKKFLDPQGSVIDDESEISWPLNSAKYTEDDLIFSTAYIDLNKCQYYKDDVAKECDCFYDAENGKARHICLYQKYGYCPYRFQTEKHCRKIRTLKGEKSNRFNLTQELSKVFEMYPIYYTAHDSTGRVIVKPDGTMQKFIFYIKEKGVENKLGFRYEKNLSNISRTIKSDQIVTKLYVSDVDSEISRTGLCSIKTAEDNPSKDSFIIDFSYYTKKGLLDRIKTDADLYGINNNDIGFLKKLGYLNTQYDEISNKIIALKGESFTELEANLEVNLNGIDAAQQQLNKYRKEMDKYKTSETSEENEVYKGYIQKFNEQMGIYCKLINETFCDPVTGARYDIDNQEIVYKNFGIFFDKKSLSQLKEMDYIKKHTYPYGMLGQFNREYKQIQEWKKQQNGYLKLINELSQDFYRKYEPFLKEGTWSDNNYITDNAYYFGAKEVAAEGAIPKVEYNIQVVDLHSLPEYEDYVFNIADTTYVEDIGMFGINQITGFPNRLKVLISGISRVLDSPKDDSIKVQNFTTQFEDLFQQVTASVQSLSFNENIYKRASNFTSNQNISESSLQGTLNGNNLQLLNTSEKNIELNKQGQFGSDINNHANKYRFNGQGMEFSNNGGQSWSTGVGPGGINADYINVGSLDAGRIRIVDNNYLYFLWDKSGITAYRDPRLAFGETSMSDYTRFNKFGLSLVENGQIRLRSGYSFNGKDGKASSEKEIGNKIGFFLYNDKGQIIFSTENNENTARISLAGEMYVCDSLVIQEKPIYKYSKLKCAAKDVNVYSITNIENSIEKYFISEMIEDILSDSFKPGFEKEYDIPVEDEGTIISIQSKIRCNNIEKIVCYSPDRKIIKDCISRNVSMQVITTYKDEEDYRQEEEYIEEVSLVDWDNIIYQLNDNVEVIKVKIEESDKEVIKEYKARELQEYVSIYEHNNDFYSFTTQFNTGYELIQNNNNYYYNEETPIRTEESLEDETIGIFINNQHINKPTQDDTLKKRLFSCVSKTSDGDDIRNIFTILNNGNLYMGGNVIQYNEDGSIIENSNNISQFSDYVDIEATDNTVMINENGVNVGSRNLLEYIDEQIRTVMTNIYLVEHSHDISGAPVESTSKEDIAGQISMSPTSGFSGKKMLPSNNFKITLAGETDRMPNEKYSLFYVDIDDFINAIALKIKEGTRTSVEGSAKPSGSSGVKGYYVEYLGG